MNYMGFFHTGDLTIPSVNSLTKSVTHLFKGGWMVRVPCSPRDSPTAEITVENAIRRLAFLEEAGCRRCASGVFPHLWLVPGSMSPSSPEGSNFHPQAAAA